MQQRFFIADLIACSTCFGHYYAHHQELKSIIQWLLPVVFRAVILKFLVWCGAEGYVSGLQDACCFTPLYNTLELLMMGIVMPETCWASNKICNKKPLLHLVGILFPHINVDARSKSHEIYQVIASLHWTEVLLPWLRFIRAFSSVIRQMPGYN